MWPSSCHAVDASSCMDTCSPLWLSLFMLQNPTECPYNGSRREDCPCRKDYTAAGLSTFSKVRLDVTTLQIITTDLQFANTTEGRPVPFATAGDCYIAAKCPQSTSPAPRNDSTSCKKVSADDITADTPSDTPPQSIKTALSCAHPDRTNTPTLIYRGAEDAIILIHVYREAVDAFDQRGRGSLLQLLQTIREACRDHTSQRNRC
ncbi:uncharacterized protein [Hyperolius riggenbachi]|uniref:uncharacterized protein isoform X2 n=2 Tax=Hyperolius riggenbachi TaxID=752182 RepID=UPI0035A3C2D2